MKILGIITEYNPYHLGHRLHLQEAKKLIKPNLTICVMSSSFVQRGEPAMISYQKRAAIAIEEGIDIVIELPLVYACQSADYFAKGAVTLLHEMGVTDLVFGSEDGNIETFLEIAEAIEQDPDTYNMKVKEGMKDGLRYPDACNQALSLLLNKSIQTPNDLLGLGYVKEVIENDYPITLHCIKRSNDYHDTTLTKIASATALRKALKEKQDVHDYLLDMSYYDSLYHQNDFFDYLKYQIIIQSPTQLKKIHLVDEGIENLLKKVIFDTNSYEELVNSLTSKRYTKTRIQRMLLHILMNNTKDEIKNCFPIDYIHVLKMNQKGQKYLKTIKKTCSYHIITNLSSYKHPALDLEIKSSKLLSLIDHQMIKKEFQNIPVIELSKR